MDVRLWIECKTQACLWQPCEIGTEIMSQTQETRACRQMRKSGPKKNLKGNCVIKET